MMKDGLTRQKGWLRDALSGNGVNKRTQLTTKESMLLTVVSCLFSRYNTVEELLKDHTKAVQHAFGVGNSVHNNIIKRFLETDCTLIRKMQADKDTSVFNCPKKQKHTFTAFNSFKQCKTRKFCDTTAALDISVLRDEFNQLPSDEREAYEILAARDLERSQHLWEELKNVLLKTKGKVSYISLANQLGNIVSHECIRRWLLAAESGWI